MLLWRTNPNHFDPELCLPGPRNRRIKRIDRWDRRDQFQFSVLGTTYSRIQITEWEWAAIMCHAPLNYFRRLPWESTTIHFWFTVKIAKTLNRTADDERNLQSTAGVFCRSPTPRPPELVSLIWMLTSIQPPQFHLSIPYLKKLYIIPSMLTWQKTI